MFEQSFRKLVHAKLRKLQHGLVIVCDGDRTDRFGDPSADLKTRIEIHDQNFYRHMVLGGEIGAAESLAQGHWTCSDLTTLVRIVIRNLPDSDLANGPLAILKNALERFGHFLRRNTITNAKQNIVKHYDLSNRFFSLFLDPSMTYSCGIFPRANCSMYEASMEKVDRACRKLGLRPSDHLLEIGTGWGALAVHAVKQYGCRVTTTTLSDRQYEFAKTRFEHEGVADRITLLQVDYRNLTGQFDKLVSIEMIEAVGHQYYDTFFRKCDELLKPTGEMLIQAITIVDHRFEHHKHTIDFINRYIFPGGCVPSLAALSQAMARTTRLRVVHLEEFAGHYAETLRRWRAAFASRLNRVRELGFDDRFIRIWEYYLCYCEAAFMQRHVNVAQIWYANQGATVMPLDRDFDRPITSFRPLETHRRTITDLAAAEVAP